MRLAPRPVFVVPLVAVLAPLLTELPVGRRVPIVVLEVVLGMFVEPHVLDLIRFDAFLSTMSTIGMADMALAPSSRRCRPCSTVKCV